MYACVRSVLFVTPIRYQDYEVVCVRYLFRITRVGFWNEIVLDEFKAFFWLKHSLFIGGHDTFHHSCTSCHEDEIVSLRIDVSSNCNKYTKK
jgi:hypothetical protein